MNESNGIAQSQLSLQNLQRLAAQRTVYNKAKTLLALRLILSGPLIIALSVFVLLFNNQKVMGYMGFGATDLSWLLAIAGVTITILDSRVFDLL